MEFKDATPESALRVLGTIQPTSKFGEMFQYSNGLAAAGGYVAGHDVAAVDLERISFQPERQRQVVEDLQRVDPDLGASILVPEQPATATDDVIERAGMGGAMQLQPAGTDPNMERPNRRGVLRVEPHEAAQKSAHDESDV